MKKYLICLGTVLIFLVNSSIVNVQAEPLVYDMVIKNGRVINPETNFDQNGINIGINKGKIEAVTAQPLTGRQVIDATGLVVSPGFIDILSYSPNPVGIWNKLADGITTNIGMHGVTADAKQWYEKYEKQNLPLNFGGSFLYTVAREKLKLGRYQKANETQIAQMVQIAENALINGCLGISVSLEYMPGVSPEECLAMMQVAHKYNVPVYYHLRYSDMEPPGTNMDALNEVIDYANETDAALHIDHINSTGGTFSMEESLALLDKARASGFDISACIYPYNFWGTYLNSARFDPGWQARFHITYDDLQLGGSPERLTLKSFEQYRKLGKLANAFAIPEEDILEALRSPWIMMGSDGILEPGFNNHPRASGMCAKLIGYYVREQKVLSLMEALAKLTILPAKRLETQAPTFKLKGRIAPGADADITIFNYNTIIDRATPEHPEIMSKGIEYVLVGGEIVKDPKGFNKDVHNGKGMKSEFVHARLSAKHFFWSDQIISALNYQGADYIDLAWLTYMNYLLDLNKPTRTFTIKQILNPVNTGNTVLKSVPRTFSEDELVLERGYKIQYNDNTVTLVSVGDKPFMPVAGLKMLGYELVEEENGIRVNKIIPEAGSLPINTLILNYYLGN